MDYFTKCWTWWVPIVISMLATIIVFQLEYHDTASAIMMFGMIATMVGNIAFIAIWDSRKKWSNASFITRLAYFLTFKR